MNAFISAILNRSRTVLTAMTVLSLAGLFFYLVLPREADPDIDIPVFTSRFRFLHFAGGF